MFLTPQQYFRLQRNKPRKRFGQHFLSQPGTAERIVTAADLQPTDNVVEVGPGLGALSQFLLPRVRTLHLVEIDRDLAGYLEKSLEGSQYHATVYRQDILTFDLISLSRSRQERLVVLGNLPYNISSPLVFRLLEAAPAVKKAVLMVQKEVGERLTAPPGTKAYGVLSVLLGVYAEVSRLFAVGPSQFYPPPQVDSLVVRIDFPESPPEGAPPFEFTRRLVNRAFQQRRKTLHNSLKSIVGKNTQLLQEAFAESATDPGRRPETLSPQEFVRLGNALRKKIHN